MSEWMIWDLFKLLSNCDIDDAGDDDMKKHDNCDANALTLTKIRGMMQIILVLIIKQE
jgi:hypothetical protein